jgi:hypothetical protein
MYSESVTIEFSEHISQSGRMKYLAALAEELEQVKEMNTDNPGFSIVMHDNGKTKIAIWHPWKRNTLFSCIKEGCEQEIFIVKSPKNFCQDY